MIIYLPENRKFKNRLECKIYLGGDVAYNKALKAGKLLFDNAKKANDIIFLND